MNSCQRSKKTKIIHVWIANWYYMILKELNVRVHVRSAVIGRFYLVHKTKMKTKQNQAKQTENNRTCYYVPCVSCNFRSLSHTQTHRFHQLLVRSFGQSDAEVELENLNGRKQMPLITNVREKKMNTKDESLWLSVIHSSQPPNRTVRARTEKKEKKLQMIWN